MESSQDMEVARSPLFGLVLPVARMKILVVLVGSIVRFWHRASKPLRLGMQNPEYGAFIVDPNGWHIEACFHGHQAEG